jgi:hypothetical protein
MPAPSIRSTSSVTGATGATFTVNKPAGTAAGDVLLAFQVVNSTTAPAAPSGFTQQESTTSGATSELYVWFKQAGGGEPASYTFSNPAGMVESHVWLLAIQNAQAAPDPGANDPTSFGATATTNSYTTAASNEMVVVGFHSPASTTWTVGAGLTDVGTLADANLSLDVAWRTRAAAGTYAGESATLDSTNYWIAALVMVGSSDVAGLPRRALVACPRVHPAILE